MRTRFPPSPTGLLHVGGLRTALYNELLARQSKGTFILRIEDTDQERKVEGAVENFLHSFAWAGVQIDEGVMMENGELTEHGAHGPYTQSKRTDLYRRYCDELLENGHAYRCFCTKERLEEMRKKQEAEKKAPMYDGRCRDLSLEEGKKRAEAGEPHVVRQKIPHDRTITFDDAIRGEVSFKAHTVDDQVLMKSDNFPTYHLANVVDDHLMEIDLVMRGEEWLSSTPKHILLYEAFGWPVPRFAHLPLLLNRDKSKLSKRQNSVSVQEYVDKGYLPEAMINFLALLGWNPGTEQEIFTKEELVEQFSLERVQKAGAVFDLEKLNWLQGQWMRAIPKDAFAARIKELVTEKFPAAATDAQFGEKAALIQDRITFFHEAPDMLGFFYEDPAVSKELLCNTKQKVTPELLPKIFTALTGMLHAIGENAWSAEHLLAAAKGTTEKEGLKLGQLLWPLRAALTGREFSPGAVEVAAVLGKETTLKRLAACAG